MSIFIKILEGVLMKILLSLIFFFIVIFADERYFIQLSAAKNINYLKELKQSQKLQNFKIIKKQNGFFALIKEAKNKKEANKILKKYRKKFKDAFIESKKIQTKTNKIVLNLSEKIKKQYKNIKDFKCYLTLPKNYEIKKESVKINGKKISSLKIEKNYLEFYLEKADTKKLSLSFSVKGNNKPSIKEIKISAFAKNEKDQIITLIENMNKKRLNLSLKAYIYDFLKQKEKGSFLG